MFYFRRGQLLKLLHRSPTINFIYFFDIILNSQKKTMENKQRFIRIVAQAAIAASTKLELDLDNIRSQFDNDLNTLTLTNTDVASAINVYLDGKKVAYVTANNGVFSFDWEFGLMYNFISIENTNAGAAIAAEKVKVFVGRSGGK